MWGSFEFSFPTPTVFSPSSSFCDEDLDNSVDVGCPPALPVFVHVPFKAEAVISQASLPLPLVCAAHITTPEDTHHHLISSPAIIYVARASDM